MVKLLIQISYKLYGVLNILICPGSVQFSSVAQSCLTLSDPMSCSTPGLPVHMSWYSNGKPDDFTKVNKRTEENQRICL